MEVYDFVKLENEIDKSVIKIVKILTDNNKNLTIIEAKKMIKDELIVNSSLYHDYKDDSFKFISTLLSLAKTTNFIDFFKIFFSKTFLLRSILILEEKNIYDKLDQISNILLVLVDIFEANGKINS